MPVLEFGGMSTEAIMGPVWLTMMMGDDLEAREAIENSIGGMVMDNMYHLAPDKVELTPEDIKLIRSAPAGDLDLLPIFGEAFKSGCLAGEIVTLVLGLRQQAPKLATINAAVRVIERRLAHINAGLDPEQRFPAAEASIKRAWRKMHSVAHFWAALFMHVDYMQRIAPRYSQIMNSQPRIADKTLQNMLTNISGLREILELDKEAAIPFLATSEAIRRDGESFNLIRQKRPFLDPDIMYRVSEDIELPIVKISYPKLTLEELELASSL